MEAGNLIFAVFYWPDDIKGASMPSPSGGILASPGRFSGGFVPGIGWAICFEVRQATRPTLMTTSLLLIDVQGFEALAKGQANPSALRDQLTHTTHGMNRQLAVMRAYCSSRVSSYRKTAYREAGFEITETTGSEDTLILMSLDLAELARADVTYQEAILMAGSADLTSLARFAREHLMSVSVVDHPSVPASLEALADGLLDVADFEIDRMSGPPPAPNFKARDRSTTEPLVARSRAAASEKETNAPETLKADPSDDKAPEASAPDDKMTEADTGTSGKSFGRNGSKTSSFGSSSLTSDRKKDAVEGDHALKKTDDAPSSEAAKSPVSESMTSPKKDRDTPKPDLPMRDGEASKVKTKADDSELESNLEEALAASLSDDLASALEDSAQPALTTQVTGSNPEPDLEADLAADIAAELDIDLPPDENSETQGTDTDLDALFADIASGDASDPMAASDVTTAVDPAAQEEPLDLGKAADAQADAEVDQLLSRLMSDDMASDPEAPKKAALDVVPER